MLDPDPKSMNPGPKHGYWYCSFFLLVQYEVERRNLLLFTIIIRQGDLVCCGVLSGNRNFEGRIHPNTRANYLASPLFVIGQPHSYTLHQIKTLSRNLLSLKYSFKISFMHSLNNLLNRWSTAVSQPKFIGAHFSLRRAVSRLLFNWVKSFFAGCFL
jgi:hypothetical protein